MQYILSESEYNRLLANSRKEVTDDDLITEQLKVAFLLALFFKNECIKGKDTGRFCNKCKIASINNGLNLEIPICKFEKLKT
jgi:hypothetical protein